MPFEIFHERLPWQPKLPCNFHKNFIYVIRTLSLISLLKISFLSQRVHRSEILRHFSQLYPPTGGVFMIQLERFKLFFKEMSHMLPAKNQPNRPGDSGVQVI